MRIEITDYTHDMGFSWYNIFDCIDNRCTCAYRAGWYDIQLVTLLAISEPLVPVEAIGETFDTAWRNLALAISRRKVAMSTGIMGDYHVIGVPALQHTPGRRAE